MARLAEKDRCRVRHHLGYLNIEPASSIQLGFPSASQPGFLVETAMDRLIDEAVPKILHFLDILDKIECHMVDALSRFKVQQLGEIKFRNTNDERTEPEMLEMEYNRWAKRLADDLGVPVNPFSERYRTGFYGGGSINTPISQV